eukprot:g5141.t1
MSRAADDVFSSLITNVPGVDTSGFVKRSLNDLKTTTQSTPKSQVVTEAVQESTAPSPPITNAVVEPPMQFEFNSLDLDFLGQTNTETVTTKPDTVQLDALFGDIPGCEEVPSITPIPPQEHTNSDIEPTMDNKQIIEDDYEDISTEDEVGGEFGNELIEQELEEDDVDGIEPMKSKFERYKSKFNKHAAKLGKRGMKAMKHGLGAAQDWVDRYVQEHKQTITANQKAKQDDKEIKRFLEDMEQLSHHRRELLLSEIPPEFFQRVMEYVKRHQLVVDHLFITSHDLEQEQKQQEDETEEYLTESEDSSVGRGSEEDHQEEKEAEVPLVDPDDLDSFFAGGAPPISSSSTHGVVENSHPSDILGGDVTGDLMHFGTTDVPSCTKSDFKKMYETLKSSGRYTEDEIRTMIRQKRHEEKQSKMQKALEAKMERDRDEEENRELLIKLKDQHLKKVVEWKERHANNMRGLLTSLESVLWEDSGWKPLTVGDVLEPIQVKKAYMKANLIIHPDKVKQKGGSAEQVVLADMVFNVLKEGWKEFQT